MNTVSIEIQQEGPDSGVNEKAVLQNIKVFCSRVLEKLAIDKWEVSLLLCGKAYMHELNKKYRNIDDSTDVLSFSQEGGFDDHPVFYAGDIVVSLEDCREQAERNGVGMEQELKRLIVHGLLHLMGFDHTSDKEEREMLEKQDEIVKNLEEVRIF